QPRQVTWKTLSQPAWAGAAPSPASTSAQTQRLTRKGLMARSPSLVPGVMGLPLLSSGNGPERTTSPSRCSSAPRRLAQFNFHCNEVDGPYNSWSERFSREMIAPGGKVDRSGKDDS